MRLLNHFPTIILLLIIGACDNTPPAEPLPYVSFQNININLTNVQYFDLTTKGYMKIDGGVKGIILYKNPFKTEYIAYERNCTYHPYDDCAIVDIDDSGLFMIDKDCCHSQFSFDNGNPIVGPAFTPLRRYRTILDGNYLTITDTPY